MFEQYLTLWNLTPDGQPFVTASSKLLPVLRGQEPAMLKLTIDEEENQGAALMEWWGGKGSARILCRDDSACLLERATGIARLPEMARSGRDEEAVRILCSVAKQLHAPWAKAPPNLVPLSHWFHDLAPAAATQGLDRRARLRFCQYLFEPRPRRGRNASCDATSRIRAAPRYSDIGCVTAASPPVALDPGLDGVVGGMASQ